MEKLVIVIMAAVGTGGGAVGNILGRIEEM